MSEPTGSQAADLEDLYENAPCGYLLLSKAGRIVAANRTLAAWTGWEPSALNGRRIHEFLSITSCIYYETHLAPLLRMQGHFSEVALDLGSRAGEKIPVLAYASERRDENDGLLYTRLILVQAGDRRRYERDLIFARNSAANTIRDERATSDLREQFIAVLGHDLRNPLAAIAIGLRLLRHEANSDHAPKVLDMMDRSVVRALDLIANVLDFARGRLGGGIALSRSTDVPLQPVIEQVVNELRAIAPDRTIVSDIAIDAPVDCDPGRIGQLVSNLLGNAITHGAADRPIRVEARTTGGLLKVSVSNGGEPIPDLAKANLFQPFFRGAAHGDQQGLGLGLFIAAHIARAHGGDLTVRSSPDETRFDFVMPSLAR